MMRNSTDGINHNSILYVAVHYRIIKYPYVNIIWFFIIVSFYLPVWSCFDRCSRTLGKRPRYKGLKRYVVLDSEPRTNHHSSISTRSNRQVPRSNIGGKAESGLC